MAGTLLPVKPRLSRNTAKKQRKGAKTPDSPRAEPREAGRARFYSAAVIDGEGRCHPRFAGPRSLRDLRHQRRGRPPEATDSFRTAERIARQVLDVVHEVELGLDLAGKDSSIGSFFPGSVSFPRRRDG